MILFVPRQRAHTWSVLSGSLSDGRSFPRGRISQGVPETPGQPLSAVMTAQGPEHARLLRQPRLAHRPRLQFPAGCHTVKP